VWTQRNRQAQARAAEEAAFRRQCIAAGLRPVNRSCDLSPEEWFQYCRFYGLDWDRKKYDLPCDSWRVHERLFGMTQIVYWYNKLERGELTREEYHRLVLEFAARPESEGSSSSGS